MVLAEFLNPGCYSQIYMIESKSKAFTCGMNEGLHWAIILSFIIIFMYVRIVAFKEKKDVDINMIKKYTFIIILAIFILLISYFSFGYVNKWVSYQDLIKKYKKQGLKDYEIFSLLEIDIGRNQGLNAISPFTSLILLRGKQEMEQKEKEKSMSEKDKQ